MTTDARDTASMEGASTLALDVEHLIGEASWGGFQKAILVLISLAVLLDGLDNQLMGFAAPAIIADWRLSPAQMVPILGLGIVAMTLGTAVAGLLGDRFGRRPTLIASVALFGASTCAMAFSGSLPILMALRLIAAFGLGGAMPIATAMLAEFTPFRHRALAITLGIVCVPLGGLLAGILSSAILPDWGWRRLFLIGGMLPLMVACIFLRLLPESPRFLLRQAGGEARLRKICSRCGIAIPAGATLIVNDHGDEQNRSLLSAILAPGLRKETLLLWAAFFGCLQAVYLVFNWAPTLLAAHGADLRLASIGLAAFNLGGVAGATFAAFQIDRLGSRRPMIIMGGGAALVAAIVGFLSPQLTDLFRITVIFATIGALASGLQTSLFALAAHVYPTRIRGTGVAFALGVGRIGAVGSASAGAWAISGGSATYFITLASSIGAATIALGFMKSHSPRIGKPHPGA